MKILLLISFYVLLTAQSCSTHGTPPVIDVALYAGDSINDGVTRSQVNDTIKCSEPRIDNMVCMTYKDFTNVIRTYETSCNTWNNGVKPIAKKLDDCGLTEEIKTCIGN